MIKKLGIGLCAIGILAIIAKAVSPEYVDESGILHESFFLLPMGFGLIFIGVAVLIAAFARKLTRKRNEQNDKG